MIDHNRAFWALLAAAFAAVFSFAAAILVGARAHAHDWYPIECCHSLVCAPVTSTSWIAGAAFDATGKAVAGAPRLVVTTRLGTAVVPDDLPRRASKDNQLHACMRPGPSGQMTIMCIFIPPGI